MFHWIPPMWHNGGRGLLIAFAFFGGSLVLLGTALISTMCQDATYAPLENHNPQRVLNPVVEQGGTLSIDALKCNHSSRDVPVEGVSYFREQESRALVKYRDGFGVRPPGCRTFHYENPIPVDLPPGVWRIEGVEVAREGDEEQREPWYTADFVVVARGT